MNNFETAKAATLREQPAFQRYIASLIDDR
jgi:hypothetical protein